MASQDDDDSVRTMPQWSRREVLKAAARAAFAGALGNPLFTMSLSGQTAARGAREFNVLEFGAAGDGVSLDSLALQRAIDAAAGAGPGSRVVIPGGRRFLTGRVELREGVELHLADDAELLASVRPEDYGAGRELLVAQEAHGVRITGSGRINGRSREFMTHYDEAEEWWRPAAFRPRLAVLTGCRDLVVQDLTFFHAPSWTLHLVGCEDVLVDRVRISGTRESRIADVRFENVDITLDRWTRYRGGVWDNRPTTVYPAIEEHATPAIHVRHADDVELRRCRVSWGKNRPDYFTHALEAHDVTALIHPGFAGEAAHPGRDAAIRIVS